MLFQFASVASMFVCLEGRGACACVSGNFNRNTISLLALEFVDLSFFRADQSLIIYYYCMYFHSVISLRVHVMSTKMNSMGGDGGGESEMSGPAIDFRFVETRKWQRSNRLWMMRTNKDQNQCQ